VNGGPAPPSPSRWSTVSLVHRPAGRPASSRWFSDAPTVSAVRPATHSARSVPHCRRSQQRLGGGVNRSVSCTACLGNDSFLRRIRGPGQLPQSVSSPEPVSITASRRQSSTDNRRRRSAARVSMVPICIVSENSVQTLVQTSVPVFVTSVCLTTSDSPPTRSGRRGRWFKSSRPDYFSKMAFRRNRRRAFSFVGQGLRRSNDGSNRPHRGCRA